MLKEKIFLRDGIGVKCVQLDFGLLSFAFVQRTKERTYKQILERVLEENGIFFEPVMINSQIYGPDIVGKDRIYEVIGMGSVFRLGETLFYGGKSWLYNLSLNSNHLESTLNQFEGIKRIMPRQEEL